MPEADDEFIGYFNKCQGRVKEKMTPAEALDGMRQAMSDLAEQDEKYRADFANYLRRRLKFIAKSPKKKVIPDEAKMLKFLLDILHFMEIQGN